MKVAWPQKNPFMIIFELAVNRILLYILHISIIYILFSIEYEAYVMLHIICLIWLLLEIVIIVCSKANSCSTNIQQCYLWIRIPSRPKNLDFRLSSMTHRLWAAYCTPCKKLRILLWVVFTRPTNFEKTVVLLYRHRLFRDLFSLYPTRFTMVKTIQNHG